MEIQIYLFSIILYDKIATRLKILKSHFGTFYDKISHKKCMKIEKDAEDF